MNAPTGIINIRGKEYQTVALRVQLFREDHPDWALTTAVVSRDADCVVMQATVADSDGNVKATGHAEEYRKASQINRTSALENAETSAIGRALASMGYGGTEFATANEVQNAIHQQDQPAANGGGEGHSEESAVSPPAAKQPAHSKLKTELRGFVRELESIGDWDQYCAFRDTADFKRLTAECEEKLPQWWEGGPDMQPEFVPLRRRIDDLEEALGKQIAGYART